jgi:hypothetical protein
MAEAPVVTSLRRAGSDRARLREPASHPAEGHSLRVDPERLRPRRPRSLSEARRTWNREHIGTVSELRCECTRPSCQGTVPAAAEAHRGRTERFIVTPAHLNGGVVARAADRFFVVEPVRPARPQSQSDLG